LPQVSNTSIAAIFHRAALTHCDFVVNLP
jgi:hypothetical protein